VFKEQVPCRNGLAQHGAQAQAPAPIPSHHPVQHHNASSHFLLQHLTPFFQAFPSPPSPPRVPHDCNCDQKGAGKRVLLLLLMMLLLLPFMVLLL